MDLDLRIDSVRRTAMKKLRIPMSKKSISISFKEDIYIVKIVELKSDEGKFGPQIQWTFKILKGKYKDATILAWTPLEARPKNKLGKWLKKLIPDLKFKDGKFDIAKALLGKKVRISIAHTEKVNDDGTPQSRVEEVFRLKKSKNDDDEEDEDDEEVEDDDEDEDEEDEEEDDDDGEDEDEDEEDEDEDVDDGEDEDEEDEEEEDESPKKKKKGKKKGKAKKEKVKKDRGKKKGKKSKGRGKKKKKKGDWEDDEDEEQEDEEGGFKW